MVWLLSNLLRGSRGLLPAARRILAWSQVPSPAVSVLVTAVTPRTCGVYFSFQASSVEEAKNNKRLKKAGVLILPKSTKHPHLKHGKGSDSLSKPEVNGRYT